MLRNLRHRLTYANIVSSLALFLVLSGGTAVALTGSNTVFTDDITNGEVRNADIGANAVNGAKVQNQSLGASDIAPDSLTAGRLAPNSATASELAGDAVSGPKVANDSLKGEDVDETSLGQVPAAANANTLDNLDSRDFARGDDGVSSFDSSLQTGAMSLANNSPATVDFGRFRIAATGTQDQFQVCNEDNATRPFVIYTGGASDSTDSARQQIEVGVGSCTPNISTGNIKGDFQVFGLDAVVFAHSSFSSAYRYYALKRAAG